MPLTPEQIAEMDATLGQAKPNIDIEEMDRVLAGKNQKGNSFLDDLKGDLYNRGENLKTINKNYQGGDINAFDRNLQRGGQLAGIAGDVMGEGIKHLTPDFVKNGASSVLNTVGSIPTIWGSTLGETASAGAKKLGQGIQYMEREHPAITGDAQALLNIGLNAAPFIPVKGTSAVRATMDTAKDIGQGVKQAVATGLEKVPMVDNALGKTVRPEITSDFLRNESSKYYKLADQKGGILKPELTNSFLDEIEKFSPQTEKGKMLAGNNEVTNTREILRSFRDQPITLQEAQEIDEHLGDIIDTFTENGHVNKQGKKILDIQSSFRNMINEASPEQIIGGADGFEALKQGRQLWATSRKLSDIERIIQRADMMENPATAIKSGFRTLLNNPQRMRGYSPEEVAAMKKASETGFITDTLKGVFGSRLNGVIAGATGGPLSGVAAAAASTASRGIANKSQIGKAIKAADVIGSSAGIEAQKIPFSQIMKMKPKEAEAILKKMKASGIVLTPASTQINK